ncbi:MAG: cell wall-active antibiotics response protein LiaF [Bacteroidota bacterium]
MNRPRNAWLGIVLILLGGFFLLDSLRAINLGDMIGTYWPVLLIVWGAWLVFKRRSPRVTVERSDGFGDVRRTVEEESLHTANVLGDIEIRVTSRAFKGGTATTVFGDVGVDCRESRLAEGEHTLRLSSVFGDAVVHVPRDAAVKVTAHTLFGDAEVFDRKKEGVSAHIVHERPDFAASPRRLVVDVSQVFGDISVQ